MNGIFFLLAAVLLLPACCTTVGAAGVFLMRTTQEPKTRRMLCGMAAGIMLAASVWSLLLPAIQRAEEGLLPAWLPPTAGLVIGAVGLLRLEQAGYDIVFHVHDEIIAEAPEGSRWQDMAEIMGRPIDWAPGLLLRGDGYETGFYRKD